MEAQPTPAAELRASILSLTAAVAAQPAAARVCLIEAYVAGPKTAAAVDAAILAAEEALHRRLLEAGPGAAHPREMTTAIVAAVVEVLRSRLVDGRVQRLADIGEELVAFLAGIEGPLRPLRAAARRVERRDEEREADDHAERALRAFEALLSDRGLDEVTMGMVAERARMSVRTLYANFADREQLMIAAVDRAATQAVAAILPAYRRGGGGAAGVRTAFTALFGFLASRPNLTHLLLCGAREGGARALSRRSEALGQIEPAVAAGIPVHLRPVAHRIGSDAILGAILGLAARRLAESGTAALPELVPIATFLVLAPAIGAAQATAVAEGKSYRKPRSEASDSLLRAESDPRHQSLLIPLAGDLRTVEQIAAEVAWPVATVARAMQQLEAAGVVVARSPDAHGRTRYQSAWRLRDTDEWEATPQAEREGMSMEIGRVIRAEVEEAFEAGTFDARPERFLVRVPLYLDDEGWKELDRRLNDALDATREVQEVATRRIREGGDPSGGTFGRVIFVSFEIPPGAPGPD
jgi:AcrR family transcriptional regulator/predicted transcriptional regulator